MAWGGDVLNGQVLHWAVERRQHCWEVVTMLLQQGALPNQVELDGVFPVWTILQSLGTPLHRAI